MDAKSPFHAGVTMGPDQIERMDAMRKLRNRLSKAGDRERLAAIRAGYTDETFYQYKRRRATATQMRNSVRKGRTIAWIAAHWKRTADEVLAEIKWVEARSQRNQRDKVRRKRAKVRRSQLGQPPSVGAVDPHLQSEGKPSTRA